MPVSFLFGLGWNVIAEPTQLVQEAAPPNATSEAPGAPDFVFDMPLSVDGNYVRDIPVGVTNDGRAFAREDQLFAILRDLAREDYLAEIGLGGEEVMTSFEALTARGLDLRYDASALSVDAFLPVEARRPREVSVAPAPDGSLPDDVLPPATFSTGVNLQVRPGYVHAGNDVGFTPLEARAEGFANLGGFNGLHLVYDVGYVEGREDPVTLDDAVLFRDFFGSAIRVAVGTLQAPVEGRFGASQRLVGGGVFRNYNAIRPFETLLPTAATAFDLERDALVTILVNGAPVLTERFQAGSYDVGDLPLTSGGNDVTVLVEEDGLSREVAIFSTYVDSALLKGGISRFGVYGGMVRESGGALPNPSDTVSLTGSYEVGLNDQFTIGASLQSLDEDYQLSARGVFGTPLGILAAEAAYQDDGDGSSFAGVLRYLFQSDPSLRTSHQFDAQILYESEGFVPLAPLPPFVGPRLRDPETTTFSARYSLQRGPLSVTASGEHVRAAGLTVSSAVLGLSYAFDAITVSMNARARWRDDPVLGEEEESAVLVSLTRRLGRRGRARLSYDTEDRTSEAQLLKLGAPFVGQWDGRLLLTDNDLGERLDAEIGYVGNRAEVSLTHLASRTGSTERAITTGQLRVGVGLADGELAWGRPFGTGFAIVSAHPSLEDRRVTLSRGEGLIEARTGPLGPALQPLRSPYRTETTTVAVEDLPIGYDLGRQALEFFAPARAGYAHTVGKGASNTLMSVLIRPDGSPMALAIGSLRRADGEEGEPAEFFTNRTGRFVAEGLEPGTYEVIMKPDDRMVGTVEIPEGAEGLVRIEAVQMERD